MLGLHQKYFVIAWLRLIRQPLLVNGVSSWDPSRPWLINHPPHYLEARVCGCGQDGPWQRFALGADLYDAGNESWSSPTAGMPHAACHKKIAKKSTAVWDFLRSARLNATLTYPEKFTCIQGNCKCPGNKMIAHEVDEENIRRSVLSRGDPSRLQLFQKKLSQCTHDHADSSPITVVVLGGSETAAHGNIACSHEGTDDFLGIPPWLPLPVRGGDLVPWANRFKALLSAAYPLCQIDVLNLAVGGTDHQWAVSHMPYLFDTPNSTRSGHAVGEVADLVVVEYSVNDGSGLGDTSVQRNVPESLRLPSDSSHSAFLLLEAMSEFVMSFLLALPSSPAVVYMAGGLHSSQDITGPYAEAAARFGVPVATVRDVASYPDSPRFVQLEGINRHTYHVWPNRSSTARSQPNTASVALHPPPKWPSNEPVEVESPLLLSDDFKVRTHKHSINWGTSRHPSTVAHLLTADTLFFATKLIAAGAGFTAADSRTKCPAEGNKDKLLGRPDDGERPPRWADQVKRYYDPRADCPDGPLTYHDAETIYVSPWRPDQLALNSTNAVGFDPASNGSHWHLVEDRIGKFGWVIEKPSGNTVLDTITFPIKFHVPGGRIAVEYLSTYENAGKVSLSFEVSESEHIEVDLDSAPAQHTGATLGDVIKPNGRATRPEHEGPGAVAPGQSVVLDSLVPNAHNALPKRKRLYPTGISVKGAPKSNATVISGTLVVRLLPLDEEINRSDSAIASMDNKRGRGRFKISSVSSC